MEFGLPIDIEKMIDDLDADGSGEIEFEEWEKLFTKDDLSAVAQNF